jgi:hypothetical protein
VILRNFIADVLVVFGIACIAAAGFMVSTPIGFLAIGCPLFFAGVRLGNK